MEYFQACLIHLNSTLMLFDVSVVINAHREGLLLLPSIRSAQQAIEHASRWGLRCELLVAMDKPDSLTSEMVHHALTSGSDGTSIINLQIGDLGRSRNEAVRQAAGKYIAFLDGDDLWCNSWLAEGVAFVENDGRLLVLHPELNFFFGHNPHVYAHIDMEDERFDASALALANVWTSLCFAPRSLLLECPYPSTDMANQIGYEDWGWNMRTIEFGAIHKIVPKTSHAIRNKAISLVRQTAAAGCFPAYPPRLFSGNIA